MAGANWTSISATHAGSTSGSTLDHCRLLRARISSSDISKSSAAVGCGEIIMPPRYVLYPQKARGFLLQVQWQVLHGYNSVTKLNYNQWGDVKWTGHKQWKLFLSVSVRLSLNRQKSLLRTSRHHFINC